MFYFISDVHLGFHERNIDRKREDKLLHLLSNLSPETEGIVILGDLFDYWFEYKTVVPAYFYRTLAKLEELAKSGMKIEYVMGNHDFGHKTFFENELGIEIIKEDTERTYHNKKFYLAHGDGKAFNDTGYLILRAILRNPISLKLFSWLHPDFGIWLASNSSKQSRGYTDKKDYGDERDGMKEFAKSKLESGYDYVIMGHRHKVEIIDHAKGKYINLGHWLGEDPTFGILEKGEFKVVSFSEYFGL